MKKLKRIANYNAGAQESREESEDAGGMGVGWQP